MRIGVALFLLIACGPRSPSPSADETTSSAASSDGDVESSAATMTATSLATTSTGAAGSETAWSSGTDACSATSPDECKLDLGDIDCSIDMQDCPPGWKCVPYSGDGDPWWDDSRCVPVARDPGTQGEPCLIEEWAYSGIDDCELGSVCVVVDTSELFGVCASLCDYGPKVCGPGLECTPPTLAGWRVCLPPCDPLAQDCDPGQGCYPFDASNGFFNCMPHSDGVFGSPCEVNAECGTGLLCSRAENVPGCETESCCTMYCDASVADASSQCPGVEDGQLCDHWFCNSAPEPALEDLGTCSTWHCN